MSFDKRAMKLMIAHSGLVNRAKTEGRQITQVEGTWAVWEYTLNHGIGSDRFCHQVVASDLSGLSQPPQCPVISKSTSHSEAS